MASNVQKLRALRARTDHELLLLLRRELDRALALVDTATTRDSPSFTQAAQMFTAARVLVGTISAFMNGDRLRIERKLNALLSRLEEVPAYRTVWPYASSFAA